MKGMIACHSCDLLVNVSALNEGEKATCPRCGTYLTRIKSDAVDRALAYAVAAVILLVLSLSFPFLSFSASGLESVMTLAATPGALYRNGMEVVAVLVAAFIILIPALVLVLQIAICLPVRNGRMRPWLKPVAKFMFNIQNWSMVEVFIIGVIVSLVKIAGMATVGLGISFWAYVGFSICFTLALSVLDRYQFWGQVEEMSGGR